MAGDTSWLTSKHTAMLQLRSSPSTAQSGIQPHASTVYTAIFRRGGVPSPAGADEEMRAIYRFAVGYCRRFAPSPTSAQSAFAHWPKVKVFADRCGAGVPIKG